MFDKSDDEMIGYLEDNGAIVWEGIDPNGEAIFKFNLPRLQEIMPELYKEVMEDIDHDLIALYEQGYVEVEYDEELNAKFKPTEKAKELMEGLGLPKPEEE